MPSWLPSAPSLRSRLLRPAAVRSAQQPGSAPSSAASDSFFLQPSGAGVIVRQRGLIEDAKITSELAVQQAFHTWRRVVRWVFRLPPPPAMAASTAEPEEEGEAAFSKPAPTPGKRQPEDSELQRDQREYGAAAAASGSRPAVYDDELEASPPGMRPLSVSQGSPVGLPSVGRGWWGWWWWVVFGTPSSPQQQQQRGGRRQGMPRSQSMRDTRKAAPSAALHTSSTALPLLPGGRQAAGGQPSLVQRRTSLDAGSTKGRSAAATAAAGARGGIRRVRSFSRTESVVQHISEVSCASDVVRLSGYPLEQHTVTTADGYVLRLERIPRPGSKDVVFFMHGVLDTSMAWVSGGKLCCTVSTPFALSPVRGPLWSSGAPH